MSLICSLDKVQRLHFKCNNHTFQRTYTLFPSTPDHLTFLIFNASYCHDMTVCR